MAESLPYERFLEAFSSVLGSKLMGVTGESQAFNGQLDEKPALIDLWLEFEGHPPLGVHGSGSGEGLVLAFEPQHPCDIGEAGEFVVRDLSNRTVLSRGIGRELRSAFLVVGVDWGLGEVLGVRLDFGEGIAPVIFEWSDELDVTDENPLDLGGDFPVLEKPVRPIPNNRDDR